jgi:hypothetical protein
MILQFRQRQRVRGQFRGQYVVGSRTVQGNELRWQLQHVRVFLHHHRFNQMPLRHLQMPLRHLQMPLRHLQMPLRHLQMPLRHLRVVVVTVAQLHWQLGRRQAPRARPA